MNAIITVFLLSLIAGLGTGLGGLIAVIRRPGPRQYGFLMGITAGVMITLSFLELVNEAWELQGFATATIGFGAGAIFMFVVDVTIPHIRFGVKEIPHSAESNAIDTPEPHRHGRRRSGQVRNRTPIEQGLLKSGILIAIGITIHNFPEGIAVGAGYMHTPAFGIFIALAILLHNIPEGIATALPLCKSGVCRWDSFRVAFLSGLAEPVGALFAALFLTSFQGLIPGALAFAGGVMVFITLDELIPAAREYGHHHFTALGIITGAIFVFLLSGFLGV
ncbi:MAG TPA: ZIP family metal transporter [Anaerolineales bacterium]|nr:ZIP family metal transporter [Anaerolineales bacterium]